MRILTLKDQFDAETFCKTVTINYGFAENYQEKDRLEHVLQRQIEYMQVSDEGEEREEYASLELIEIYDSACYVLVVIHTEMYDYSDFFENFTRKGESNA